MLLQCYYHARSVAGCVKLCRCIVIRTARVIMHLVDLMCQVWRWRPCFCGDHPAACTSTLCSNAQIASWLALRALQLDEATGQLPDAVQLLELAVDKGYGAFQVQLALTCHTSSSLHTAAAAAATESHMSMSLSHLLVQARVLLQLVRSWWPAGKQQQADEQQHVTEHQAAWDSYDEQALDSPEAAREALAAVPQPLWGVTLQQWVTLGLLGQLRAVFDGCKREVSQKDLSDRCAHCFCPTRCAAHVMCDKGAAVVFDTFH